MTKSEWVPLWRKWKFKIQKSVLTVYYRELNDSKHFQQIFLDPSNFSKTEPHLELQKMGFRIFYTWNFQGK